MAEDEEGQVSGVARRRIFNEPEDRVQMNRWRLEVLLRDLQGTADRPTLHNQNVWLWIGLALAFIFPVLAADFREPFLGLAASTWEAAVVFGLIVFVLLTAKGCYHVGKYHIGHRGQHEPTARELVENLMSEMDELKP